MNKDLVKHSELCARIPFLCDEEAATAVLSDSEQDFMVVTGVNHKATNRATYASLALVGLTDLNSIGGVSDMNYTGSAEHYLGEDDEVAKYLYTFTFARDCTGRKFCFQASSSGNQSIPLTDQILFVERMYVNPLTHIGGDESEMISPYVLHYAPLNKKILAEQAAAAAAAIAIIAKLFGW